MRLLLLLLPLCCLFLSPWCAQGHVGVYWRGGKLLRHTTSPGIHIRVPLIDTYEAIQVGCGQGGLRLVRAAVRCHTDARTTAYCSDQGPGSRCARHMHHHCHAATSVDLQGPCSGTAFAAVNAAKVLVSGSAVPSPPHAPKGGGRLSTTHYKGADHPTSAHPQVTMQTDKVTNILCGTKGGVSITFEKIEVKRVAEGDSGPWVSPYTSRLGIVNQA